MSIVNTVISEWWLIGFFFTLGGIWWQGKSWFDGVNKQLADTTNVHSEQNKILTELHNKINNIQQRVERIDLTLSKVHEEVHEQEIKLAVLESKNQ